VRRGECHLHHHPQPAADLLRPQRAHILLRPAWARSAFAPPGFAPRRAPSPPLPQLAADLRPQHTHIRIRLRLARARSSGGRRKRRAATSLRCRELPLVVPCRREVPLVVGAACPLEPQGQGRQRLAGDRRS
jgi:hypothetical protein